VESSSLPRAPLGKPESGKLRVDPIENEYNIDTRRKKWG